MPGLIIALALLVLCAAVFIRIRLHRNKKQAPARGGEEAEVARTRIATPAEFRPAASPPIAPTPEEEDAPRTMSIVPKELQPIREKYWMVPETFVVFDLETTGLSPNRNKIIEIGAIKCRRADLYAEHVAKGFQALIKISSRLPPIIKEITGLDDAILRREGIPLQDALKGFLEFVEDYPLVAFNAEFDIAFLRKALGESHILKNQVICCLSMMRQAYPGLPSYQLVNLTSSMEEAERAHRAVGDAQRAALVYLIAAVKLERGW